MKSYRVTGSTPDALKLCDEPMPTLQRGELLIEVDSGQRRRRPGDRGG